MNKLSNQTANRSRSVELQSARLYCRQLARGHYENFIVGSVLCPREYMQHLYNIYAFCRIADDLADEVGDAQRSLQLLDAWEEEFGLCYGGHPRHPALIALQDTITRFDIPAQLFYDLMSAFKQDCTVSRYDTYSDLLEYCECSANPVGRLFLWLFGYRDTERQELSDRICTGLQLVNFLQDIVDDFARGRVYIPQEDLRSFGCDESCIANKEMTGAFRELMVFETNRAHDCFRQGESLPSMLDGRIRVDVQLFRNGGLAVIEQIRNSEYDVLSRRPRVSKIQQFKLFLGCLLSRR